MPPISFLLTSHTTPAIRLAQLLFSQSKGVRLAQLLSITASLAFCSSMVFLSLHHQPSSIMHIVPRALCCIACICATIIGWIGATNQEAGEKSLGISDLAKSHGVSAPQLHLAKAIVATTHTAKLVFLSAIPLVIVAASLAHSLRGAALRIAAVFPAMLFAAATGLLAGALSNACAWLSPTRGKSLFFAVVLLPWWMQGLLAHHGRHLTSLPALLEYLADLVTSFGGAS